MNMHDVLKAKINELPAEVPANVQSGLLQLLEQCGPIALSIVVQILEAAHPDWAPLLETLKAALLQLLTGLGSSN